MCVCVVCVSEFSISPRPREPAVLISHVSIRKGDTGCVVVGGRVSGKPAPQDSFTRSGISLSLSLSPSLPLSLSPSPSLPLPLSLPLSPSLPLSLYIFSLSLSPSLPLSLSPSIYSLSPSLPLSLSPSPSLPLSLSLDVSLSPSLSMSLVCSSYTLYVCPLSPNRARRGEKMADEKEMVYQSVPPNSV